MSRQSTINIQTACTTSISLVEYAIFSLLLCWTILLITPFCYANLLSIHWYLYMDYLTYHQPGIATYERWEPCSPILFPMH